MLAVRQTNREYSDGDKMEVKAMSRAQARFERTSVRRHRLADMGILERRCRLDTDLASERACATSKKLRLRLRN